jgi:hypothetical protein
MKPKSLLLGALAGLSPVLHAGWVVQSEAAHIAYSANPKEGYASFDEALKQMAAEGRIQKLDAIVAYALLPDETLQSEVFAGLERDAPLELKAARESAGNMHDPGMRQVGKAFSKAVLATPTLTRLNASLAVHGLVIAKAEVEKLELRNTLTDPRRRFHGLLWLSVSKSPGNAEQRL